jgi:hypothetical protein
MRSCVTSTPKLTVTVPTTALALIGVTVVAALATGLTLGVHGSLLVFLSGGLLGGILLVWHSLRTLAGDADVDPALDFAARSRAPTALGEQKQRALRALKDIEQEHTMGKIDDADFAVLDAEYRARAKDVIREMDASLDPFRDKAEALVKAHLEKRVARPKPTSVLNDEYVCSSCETVNDPDAAFCKKCGAKLTSAA